LPKKLPKAQNIKCLKKIFWEDKCSLAISKFSEKHKQLPKPALSKNTTIFIYYYVIQCFTMETVSVRFEESFVHDMEKAMKGHRYATKTEFIREAVRDKIKDLEKQAALLRLQQAYGAGAKKGRNITKKDIDQAGEEAVKELAQSLGVEL